MNIKTATMTAIIGVSISLLIGLIIDINRLTSMLRGISMSTPIIVVSVLSLISFLALHIGLLVFLITLYKRQ